MEANAAGAFIGVRGWTTTHSIFLRSVNMVDRRVKWLAYTVLVGLIPIGSRFLIWLVSTSNTMPLFNPSDFVAFGLVLHISNINEIEHIGANDHNWKTIQNGVSLAFIVFYGVLYALTVMSDMSPGIINLETIKYSAMILCVVSLFLSYSVFHRVSMIEKGGG
ncbi:hypothetical protein P1P91_06430 [Halomonas piscis]|uniref:Uncharacterized protein n=2 Tax=Halomonas TaxID=2745 RepID=A0ABY9Z3M5_9GAMM|nr:hypothetical protein [Halomonas piscis]WNK21305.1 hypothetical protein P1P91_06430 [Halomonas piscis]